MRATTLPVAPSAARISALRASSTAIVLFGVLLSIIAALGAEQPDDVFALPAPVLGAALALAFGTEARAGVRNLIRVDLFMLAVLYMLTFLEFLFPQPTVTGLVTLEGARTGVVAALTGFGGIALGRHLAPIRGIPIGRQVEFKPSELFALFASAALIGYLHMLVAVRFNVFDLVYWTAQPRFSQPWTRGRLGGWSSLLTELGLLIYLLPPLAGAVLSERRRYRAWQKLVVLAVFGFTLFAGFAGGTRNVVLVYLITFMASYLLLRKNMSWKRTIIVAVPFLAATWLSVFYLPEIRTKGLQSFDFSSSETETLFVDMNLVNIANLTDVFPNYEPYLGLEIPYIAIIRPIPRAVWPSKPEGLSVSIESALGASGLTLAATFVGEMWMSGGIFAVVISSVLFGWAAGRWNRVGQNASSNAQLVLYASGFFAAGIGMRSLMSVAPTLLPTIALIAYFRILGRKRL